MLVTGVGHSSGWGALQEHDVLLALDGAPITNDGKVHGLDMRHVVAMKHVGEEVKLKVLRKGSGQLEINVR